MSVMIETKLSAAELISLAGLLAGKPLARASDRITAYRRLRATMENQLGAVFREEFFNAVVSATSLEDAQKAVKAAMARMGNGEHRPRSDEPEEHENMATATLKATTAKKTAKAEVKPSTEKKAKEKVAKEKVAKEKSEGSGSKPGVRSEFSGKRLYPTVKENPRREGSHGWKSFEIVLNEKGVLLEEAVEKGGRLVDYRWDIAKGYIEAR